LEEEMTLNFDLKKVAEEIAPSGTLRVGLNMANFLFGACWFSRK
jgi:hypothetical protein